MFPWARATIDASLSQTATSNSIQFYLQYIVPYTIRIVSGCFTEAESQSVNPQETTVAMKNSLLVGRNLEQMDTGQWSECSFMSIWNYEILPFVHSPCEDIMNLFLSLCGCSLEWWINCNQTQLHLDADEPIRSTACWDVHFMSRCVHLLGHLFLILDVVCPCWYEGEPQAMTHFSSLHPQKKTAGSCVLHATFLSPLGVTVRTTSVSWLN